MDSDRPLDSSPTVLPTSNANGSSSSLGAPTVSPPERSNSQSSHHKPGHIASHRQSFAENQRHPPPSPRAHRHPSFTQQAIQELLNHPPSNRHPNTRYAGREWRDIALGELASDEVRWVDLDTSIEDATMLLVKNNPSNVVLVRETPASTTAVSTFDHNDLNAYLLVVLGLAKPDEEHVELYDGISKKAQSQTAIALREIQSICRKEQLVALPAELTLDKAMEAFGSGIHRLLLTNQASEVVGILSQLRLLEFFWNEAVNFPVIDRLYGSVLRDLQIGTQQIIAINADAPLADALLLMNTEGLSSVAVVDHGLNVVGNISTADVRLLTSAASLPLLKSSSMHFISVILSERGVERGRDSFPVFYVNPYSTLAHTVAKLVATHSHRMWVVESASPSPSAPATPLLQPSYPSGTLASAPAAAPGAVTGAGSSPPPGPSIIVPPATPVLSAPQSPLPGQSFVSVPSAALPGAGLSGRLTGVVSLTDILNLFARSGGLHPSDPAEQRARRRRSSSSSVRPNLEGGRVSLDVRR
ncbi:hypothetical protein B0T26DRAFT_371233 [Lasiosphaeria miniovina]|uniref:Protein SDS23 n=1 Tax=Lasiosphaeria miniovina TaxID=1954250 RepID=A0AA40ADC3_9PEZI|nr:uncharacterized protein B0T26DRAFT_371233 [Lasiosphaeria miniovina]KAK0713786.1 hypothetical protein B0T26DRAFT_371233 [Lasiosphaeria miniovina]